VKSLILKQFLLATLASFLGCGHAVAQIFTNLCNLNGYGSYPFGGLVLSGNILYGTVNVGGPNGGGAVFAINTDGTGLTNLFNFTYHENSQYTNSDGAGPFGSLALYSNTLYGTTGFGGISGNGTIFKINTDGTGFTNLYDFSATSTNFLGIYTNGDGASPSSSLILSSDILYGTAKEGGLFGAGTIFKISTDGTGFTNLYNFNGDGGAGPAAGLVLFGNAFYGTTQGGGTSDDGTVFTVHTDGTCFTTLYNFTNGSDGAYPQDVLVLSGKMLYGTAERGGSSGSGTIFAINTNGMCFTNLYSFTASAPFNNDGSYPIAGLTLSGNTLYGTTSGGGTGADGTVFAIHTDGTDFTNLYNIYPSEIEGMAPYASLILSGNTLYGTTAYGGAGGNGTVFALSLGPIPLNIQASGQNQAIAWGNPAFSLQTASALTGPWTTLSNGASPYTVVTTNAHAFFQLVYTNGP
jgi:uncharacterized repeat protein (TIGR03803 family)